MHSSYYYCYRQIYLSHIIGYTIMSVLSSPGSCHKREENCRIETFWISQHVLIILKFKYFFVLFSIFKRYHTVEKILLPCDFFFPLYHIPICFYPTTWLYPKIMPPDMLILRTSRHNPNKIPAGQNERKNRKPFPVFLSWCAVSDVRRLFSF